jgi:predicted peptidase
MNLIQWVTLSILICCAARARGDSRDSQFDKTITKQVGLRYRTVFPKKYDANQTYPLLIFLHGRGEQGDDLDRVQIHGPFKKAAELDLPLIIVSPQSPLDEWWDTDALSALVDHLLETLPVDKSRVYLTGLSMGGQGTWNLGIRRPEVFAAIAPICGYSAPSKAETLRDTPTWIFHGEKDDTIRVHESTKMADALHKIGNDARLTIYPNVGHDSWTETYNNPQLYQWFLSHRKQ